MLDSKIGPLHLLFCLRCSKLLGGKQGKFIFAYLLPWRGHDRIVEYLYCLPSMTFKRFLRGQHIKPHISRQFPRGTYPCLASFSNTQAAINHLYVVIFTLPVLSNQSTISKTRRMVPSLEPCPSQTRHMVSHKNSVMPWACSRGYDRHHISKLHLKSQHLQKEFSF